MIVDNVIPGLEYLSFSRIDRYRSCSLSYRFRYVDRLPSAFTPGALAFGVAWHEGAARGLDSLLAGERPAIEDLVETFTGSLAGFEEGSPIRWSGKTDRKKAVAQARSMFEVWVAWDRPAARILAVEQEFEIELAAWLPRITGRIDLIEEGPDEIRIIDIKTSRSKWSEADAVLKADQLAIYRHAFGHLVEELGKPIVMEFEVITKQKSPQVHRVRVPVNGGSIDRQVKIASTMVEGVEHSVFLPNPGWTCSTCPYQEACRGW